MLRYSKPAILIVWIAVLGQTVLAHLALPKAENDEVFAKFIKLQMEEYSNWVSRNGYDPSPPVVDHVMVSSTFATKVALSCDIINQIMTGHSNRSLETVETESDFEKHVIVVIRNTSNTYHISVNLTCSGRVDSDWYSSDLKEDIYFRGSGILRFSVIKSTEIFQLDNVGITQDHKLNLKEGYYYYKLAAISDARNFEATWNDTRLQSDPYAADILCEMGEIYKGFLWFDKAKNQYSAPFQLLTTYFLDFAADLDLKKVLVGVSLPNPYDPPTATTTTSTTTPPTTMETTTGTTETGTSESSKATVLSLASYMLQAFLFSIVISYKQIL